MTQRRAKQDFCHPPFCRKLYSVQSRLIAGLATLLFGSGCGASSDLPAGPDGECNARVAEHPIEGSQHVPDCSKLTFNTNPPSSGNHYSEWGAFGVYQSPLPRGNWVHNLEHGSIVFSYRCPNGCDEEIAAAKAMLPDLSLDPGCGTTRRVLLMPDPKLNVRWAASAWGFTLRSDCFDEQAMRDFYADHVGQGPEEVCSAGTEFRNSDGSLNVPANCGD